MQRRHLLRTVALATTMGLAGCTESGVESAGTPTVTATPSPTETPTLEDGPASVGGSTTDPTESPTDSPTDSPTGTAEPTETPTEAAPSTETATPVPTFGDLQIDFENNYRFVVDASEAPGVIEGARNGGDFVSFLTFDGETFEVYSVGGVTFLVTDGQCTKLEQPPSASTGVDVDGLTDTDDVEKNVQEYDTVVSNGTTTLDGETVYVFELRASQVEVNADVTYYVSVSTNRLRRVETQDVTIDYYDWGKVGPIQAPC